MQQRHAELRTAAVIDRHRQQVHRCMAGWRGLLGWRRQRERAGLRAQAALLARWAGGCARWLEDLEARGLAIQARQLELAVFDCAHRLALDRGVAAVLVGVERARQQEERQALSDRVARCLAEENQPAIRARQAAVRARATHRLGVSSRALGDAWARQQRGGTRHAPAASARRHLRDRDQHLVSERSRER